LRGRECLLLLGLLAVIVGGSGMALDAAGWTDHLELVKIIGIAGIGAGWAIGRSKLPGIWAHLLGLSSGAALATLMYATFVPAPGFPESMQLFADRVFQWLRAAASGAASTDNLLFAYSMALLAWLFGYLGAWGVFSRLNPWLAIVPPGIALLLNLSYASPELLPYVFVYLLASFLLMMTLNQAGRVARWRFEDVEHALHPGSGYALAGAAVGLGIVLVAWRMPVGDVSRAITPIWEQFQGPWQDLQANFDRLYASLNPSPTSIRGLATLQSLAPRGSFELGDKPVLRVTGQQPSYWRAATYDRYTGQLMTNSSAATDRRERRQPLVDATEADEGRRYGEYGFTVLAPGSSVIYAPDSPVTVSVPTVYEHRADLHDFALLRPVAALHEQQTYSVLASVPSVSVSELRQAPTIYPSWVQRENLQLPSTFPEAVRQQAWSVVGDATTVYDAAANMESYLRTLPYKTRVRVPPPGEDWVSFLIFSSKEGYCDYYATAMAVMLRSVGIPARVATGYVTGEWDPASQSYLVRENDAHTWTEVYFPGYGWITFEPSGNRDLPARPEFPLVATSPEEVQSIVQAEVGQSDFLDNEDDLDDTSFVALPDPSGAGGLSWLLMVAVGLLILVIGSAAGLGLAWMRSLAALPAFGRPYARIVRLATWSGFGPHASHTPYEFATELGRVLPGAAGQLRAVSTAYVEALYGKRPPTVHDLQTLDRTGKEIGGQILRTLGLRRVRRALGSRLVAIIGDRR
ncbi:MAG TPA: transglutaminase domain-containing protein, partial [Chloroflexota bacterium]